MGGYTSEQCHWVIQPLLTAGLALEDIREHIFRLAFDEIVTPAGNGVAHLVGDQPGHLRGAWVEVVHRMITLQAPLR